MVKLSLTVLLMGWAWALRLCRLVVEKFVAREVGEEQLVKDGAAHNVVRRGVDIGAAYVDNVLMFSGAGERATRRLNRVGRTSRPPACWCTRSVRPSVRPTF